MLIFFGVVLIQDLAFLVNKGDFEDHLLNGACTLHYKGDVAANDRHSTHQPPALSIAHLFRILSALVVAHDSSSDSFFFSLAPAARISQFQRRFAILCSILRMLCLVRIAISHRVAYDSRHAFADFLFIKCKIYCRCSNICLNKPSIHLFLGNNSNWSRSYLSLIEKHNFAKKILSTGPDQMTAAALKFSKRMILTALQWFQSKWAESTGNRIETNTLSTHDSAARNYFSFISLSNQPIRFSGIPAFLIDPVNSEIWVIYSTVRCFNLETVLW